MGNHHSSSPSASSPDRKHARVARHRAHSKIESACLEIIREELLSRLQDDYGPWNKTSTAPPLDVQTQLEHEFKKNIRHYVEKSYKKVCKTYKKLSKKKTMLRPFDRWLHRLSTPVDEIGLLIEGTGEYVVENAELLREISKTHQKLKSLVDNKRVVTPPLSLTISKTTSEPVIDLRRVRRKASCTSMNLVKTFQQLVESNDTANDQPSSPIRFLRSSISKRHSSFSNLAAPQPRRNPNNRYSNVLNSPDHEQLMDEEFGSPAERNLVAIPEERLRDVFVTLASTSELPPGGLQAPPLPTPIKPFPELTVNVDKPMSDTLTFEAFKASLTDKDMDMGLSQEELLRVWKHIDQDSDGNITFEAFSRAVRKIVFLREVVTNLGKAKTKFSVPDDYDYTKSTNFNYSQPEKNDVLVDAGSKRASWERGHRFVGNYKDTRASRDYNYHVYYIPERQHWQDALIASVVRRTEPQPNPWIIFTCGPMGVGKGYTLYWLSANGYFPLENIVHVDPDHFKRCMPEWEHYVALDKEKAGVHCHRESCYIAEIAQELAMNNSQNVWVDGSLRDGDWYGYLFKQIRRNFPQYRIAIFYISASEITIRQRLKTRAERTGRVVAESLIIDSLQSMANSLEKLTPLADFVARIANEHMPTLLSVEKIDLSGVWDVLKERFASVHSNPGDFPNSLAPFILVPLQTLHARFITKRDMGTVVEKNTPAALKRIFKQVLTLEGHTEDIFNFARTKPITVKVHLAKLCSDPGSASWIGSKGDVARFAFRLSDEDMVLSPVCPINLNDEARRTAGIPDTAASFAWAYPHPEVDLKAMRKYGLDMHAPMLLFLWMGAFVYFDADGEIVAVNVLDSTYQRNRQQIHNTRVDMLQFGAPLELKNYTIADLKKLGNRWQPVNTPSHYKVGSRLMAWLKPFEKIGFGNQTPFGSFVFLFHRLDGIPKDEDRSRNVYFPVIGN